MYAASTVILIMLLYVGALLALALWTERRIASGSNPAANPWVYSLSLAVFLTSWTYYGSVGMAATSGPAFLSFYLGATLGALLWWPCLRRLVRIKNLKGITSIADFISARYDKSQGLAILTTLVALIGITPYISLQLKAVFDSFAIITLPPGETTSWHVQAMNPIVVGLMILFTIMFGARRLDPTERHQGMVMALAAECLVKQLAFLAAGLFITWGLFDGPGDIFQRLAATPYSNLLTLGPESPTSYVKWFNLILLGLFPFLLLPRQFHVAVVENHDENHIRTALWLIPLYMLVISLFVLPIAAAGLLQGLPPKAGDTFVLALPLASGKAWLATLVFIGGFSAATGMIMVSTLALSTMATNHLLLPLLERVTLLSGLRRYLLQCRWALIALILLGSYVFERLVGGSHMLVAIGVISFLAVLQFAPVVLGGLFWKGANRCGALLGLGSGFLLWGHTALVPALVRSGWLGASLLETGPWGLRLLRPEHLLGISDLDPVSHSLFWSLAINLGLYVLGSLVFRQSEREADIAGEFTSGLTLAIPHPQLPPQEAGIAMGEKHHRALELLGMYMNPQRAREALDQALCDSRIEARQSVDITELAEFHSALEKKLAGCIGAASAFEAMKKHFPLSQVETRHLSEAYSKLMAELRLTPAELRERINFHRERELLLGAHAAELEAKVRERDQQIEERHKAEREIKHHAAQLEEAFREMESLSYTISHDLRSPLRGIDGFSHILVDEFENELPEGAREYLKKIRANSKKMGILIDDLLCYMSLVRKPLVKKEVFPQELVRQIFGNFQRNQPDQQAELSLAALPPCQTDPELLRAILTQLIGNALKFSQKREVSRIEVGAQEQNGETVYFVRDNGVGFDMRYAGKLFNIFQRLHPGEEFEGTGVGLATVHRIIRKHGGRIWAQAQPQKGATFYFTL